MKHLPAGLHEVMQDVHPVCETGCPPKDWKKPGAVLYKKEVNMHSTIEGLLHSTWQNAYIGNVPYLLLFEPIKSDI